MTAADHEHTPEEMATLLRKYANRTPGYIYADEIGVLCAAADVLADVRREREQHAEEIAEYERKLELDEKRTSMLIAEVVDAFRDARAALAATQEPPDGFTADIPHGKSVGMPPAAVGLGLSPFWNSPTGEGEVDDRCDECFTANADRCPHREPPADGGDR